MERKAKEKKEKWCAHCFAAQSTARLWKLKCTGPTSRHTYQDSNPIEHQDSLFPDYEPTAVFPANKKNGTGMNVGTKY